VGNCEGKWPARRSFYQCGIIVAWDRVQWVAVVSTAVNFAFHKINLFHSFLFYFFIFLCFWVGGGGAGWAASMSSRAPRLCIVWLVYSAASLLVCYDLHVTPHPGEVWVVFFHIVSWSWARVCSQLIHSCYCGAPVLLCVWAVEGALVPPSPFSLHKWLSVGCRCRSTCKEVGHYVAQKPKEVRAVWNIQWQVLRQ
jgi:hypothetical protein